MSLGLLVLWLAALGAGPAPADASDYVRVEVRGTLLAGMVAIGGETTGILIRSRGASWELDLGRIPDGAARAASLDGRTVIVKGTLEVRRGVERRERTVVTVTSLEAVPAEPAR